MKRSLIVGSQGQDGRFLFDQLAAAGHAVVGIGRSAIRSCGLSRPPASPVDILDPLQVANLFRLTAPDEIYYLAAFHHSAEDRIPDTHETFTRSHDIHVRGLLNCLHAAVELAPHAKLFYAASSHVFGLPPTPIQNEDTPLNPQCVYGITKTAAVHLCRFYRRNHNLFASVGYLYNHESPHRRPEFLSQKIARAAVAIKSGRQSSLVLGDLSAAVDWGYAPDFADAMARILALDAPDEFIIATGISHTVRDFAAAAFASLGLDYSAHVSENAAIALKKRAPLVGDASRLRARTGWKPSISFEQMVALLVAHAAAQPS